MSDGLRRRSLPGELWDLQGRGAESLNLQDAVHKRIDGIVLISSVINFQAIAFDPGNNRPTSSHSHLMSPPHGSTGKAPL